MMENGQGNASINTEIVHVNKSILLYEGNDEKRKAKNSMEMNDLRENDRMTWMAIKGDFEAVGISVDNPNKKKDPYCLM